MLSWFYNFSIGICFCIYQLRDIWQLHLFLTFVVFVFIQILYYTLTPSYSLFKYSLLLKFFVLNVFLSVGDLLKCLFANLRKILVTFVILQLYGELNHNTLWHLFLFLAFILLHCISHSLI